MNEDLDKNCPACMHKIFVGHVGDLEKVLCERHLKKHFKMQAETINEYLKS